MTVSDGHLKAAKAAGAHDEFVAFVAEYPDCPVAGTLETAIALDALDEFEGFAGSFGGSLFTHGASHPGDVDRENTERMRALFDDSQLPEWMQEADE